MSDNPFLVPYLSGLFQRSGWTVDGAGTRQAGIAYLHTRRAAVAVCDETLPDGSWRDVASTLPLLPDAPTLVVIGDDPSLLDEVAALGGFDVLARPIREADVVWTIASAWHAWRKRFDENAKGVIRCSDA